MSTADLATPATGRSAWPSNGRGGTLTPSGAPGGLYLYRVGSPIVGQAGAVAGADLDHRAVHAGVLAIQDALGWHGVTIQADGLYGPVTAAAVTSFNTACPAPTHGDPAHPADPPGTVGRGTAYRLFAPIITAYAQAHQVPPGIVHGIVELESGWDPGAVGYSTPQDLGLAQWRTPMEHDGVMVDEAVAFNPFMALALLAQSQATFYASLKHWALTVAAHHAPAWAADLATTAAGWTADSPQGKSWVYLNFVLNHTG